MIIRRVIWLIADPDMPFIISTRDVLTLLVLVIESLLSAAYNTANRQIYSLNQQIRTQELSLIFVDRQLVLL